MTSEATRSDPEKHKEQVRAANRARHRAVKRLITRHPDEWELLYADEAKKEGVEPKPRTLPHVVQMEQQIAELTAELAKAKRAKSARARKAPAR